MDDPADLLRRDRAHLWHPFTQMKTFESDPPTVLTGAEGVWLHTADGRRLLDGIASWWVNLLGHREPRLDAALKRQIDTMAHVMFARFTHEPAVLLAERLAAIAPPGLTRVFYSDNGSTAVEVALKMAFQHWQNLGQRRPRFLSFERAYHGDTLGAVSVGGVETYHAHWAPLLFPVLRAPSPFDAADPEGASLRSLSAVEALLSTHRGEVAAVIVEPLLQAAGGMATHPPAFLKGLRALCDAHDTLLIFDEVATGFGRTGRLWATDHAEVSPDLMCLSKAITGGYLPLGVTLATEAVFASFYGDTSRTFYHGHSFTGNPLATALGAEVLSIVAQPAWQTDVAEKSSRLQARWAARLTGLPGVRHLRGVGMVAAAELGDPRGGPLPPGGRWPWRVAAGCVARGLYVRPLGDVLYLWPPLAISAAEIDWAVDVIADVMAQTPAED